MSEALDPIRANAGADSACAWPGCGLARAAWFRVETKPGIGEHLAVCRPHAIAAEREPDVALRVWREQSIGKAPRQHVDHVLAGSLLREINRVPGISRERLLAWRRIQLPPREAGSAWATEHDDDTRAALDSLARDGTVKCRRNALATAYWPIDEDDDTSEEIEPCLTPTSSGVAGTNAATTAAVGTASATTTNSASVPAAAAPTSTTATTAPTRTRTATSLLPGAAAAAVAAAAPDDDCKPRAISRPAAEPIESLPASEPSKPSPVPTAPDEASPSAATTAPTSLSDSESTMTKRARILEYLATHPDMTSAEVIKACKGVVDADLRGMRQAGLVTSRQTEERGTHGGRPLLRWSSVADKPKPVEEPLPGGVLDWKARAERAEARLAALESEAAEVRNAVAEGGWASGKGTGDPDFTGPKLKDAADVIREFYRFRENVWNEDAAKESAVAESAPALERDALRLILRDLGIGDSVDVAGVRILLTSIRDDANRLLPLRQQLDAVSDVVVFEAESFAPEGTMDTSEFVRHTLRALKSRLAASEAREKELLDAAPVSPTIDGIPYDAALRLITEVLDIDTSEPGPATIYDLSRVLQEIGKLRAASC